MNKINLILDTDIGCDCDDAGAMAVMHRLADNGECNILAVTHCTSRLSGAGCIDAINRYYGRYEIPVGMYMGENFLNDERYELFSREISRKFDNKFSNETKPMEAVLLLRKILAQADDNSVVIAAIGPLNNMALLVESKQDEISSLTGKELISKKVKFMAAMGCHFPETSFKIFFSGKQMKAEWNITQDIKSAQIVSENWIPPIIYVPFEVGYMIKTGSRLMKETDDNNPVHLAYELYCNGIRESWDQATVLYAVRGLSDYFRISSKGHITFNEEGISKFTPSIEGKDRYLMLSDNINLLTKVIEDLMI